jgi:Costars
MGTLKAARKRGVIDFKGQMLLKGNKEHENTVITLLKPIEA